MQGTNRSGEGWDEPAMWPQIQIRVMTRREREKERGEYNKWGGKKINRNQPTNQTSSPLVHQSTNRPINQSTNQPPQPIGCLRCTKSRGVGKYPNIMWNQRTSQPKADPTQGKNNKKPNLLKTAKVVLLTFSFFFSEFLWVGLRPWGMMAFGWFSCSIYTCKEYVFWPYPTQNSFGKLQTP